MKKRMFTVLIVFLLAVSLVSAAAEECGFFCQMGQWWDSFTLGENAAGKAPGRL